MRKYGKGVYMITNLELKNFKCFKKIKISLSNINILTGINGMGKSTIIQSILLIKQSGKIFDESKELLLNGKYVNLGLGQDVLYEKADDDEIEINLSVDNASEKSIYGYSARRDALPLMDVNIDGDIESLYRTIDRIVYLSAYRIPPRMTYGIENDDYLEKREFSKEGEYAVQYLKMHDGDTVINSNVIIGDGVNITLAAQVNEWLNMISPGVSPIIAVNQSARNVELRYEYIEDRNKTNSYKSVNVGFGITYVLPIVVALVSSKPNDIIIIENPEAHIHPRGQRMLGELIARAGAGGAQVIVETHSDHILNGIRVATKKGLANSRSIGIFFFYRDNDDSYAHKVIKPILGSDGRIDDWPDGFFDEWDNALMELL